MTMQSLPAVKHHHRDKLFLKFQLDLTDLHAKITADNQGTKMLLVCSSYGGVDMILVMMHKKLGLLFLGTPL